MDKRIVLAADDLSIEQLLSLMKVVGSRLYAVKIHNLFDEHGVKIIEWLKNFDTKIWVDAKLHDIPATVAKRAAAIKRAGADILTVHASGGIDMMKAAVENGPEEIFGITVLTSLNETTVARIYGATVENAVHQLFGFGVKAGVHGLVCSPLETAKINDLWPHAEGPPPKLVTPGIRLLDARADDQARIATPGQAVLNGSDLLVIGRPITQAENPLEMIARIEAEVQQALSEKVGA